MKTAISIPDDIFEQAEGVARKLKMSRSEFYAKAIATFLEEQHIDDVTMKLNEIYSRRESKTDLQLLKAQAKILASEKW